MLQIISSVSIDVDITSAIMALLFITLYFILKPLIIQPYLRARDARAEATVGAREEADEFQQRAETTINDYEEKMVVARREAVEVRDSLKAQGASEYEEVVEETRVEIAAKLAEERAQILSQVDEAKAALNARAATLSDSIVSKVLPRAS